jgi:hypothetical protein
MLSWWKSHKVEYNGEMISFPPVHLAFLPQKTFVVSDNNSDLYCACFYETDSAMCYVAYPISNLETSKEQREGGLEALFDSMEEYAKKEGYFLMYTTSPIKAVQDALLNVGYVFGDIAVSQLLKQIV